MRVILIRHAQTAGNLAGRYIGRTDEPLAEEGCRRAQETGVFPGISHVFVSPMRRARQTCGLLFPNAEMVLTEDLREMDFGDFESRSAAEMKDDAAYLRWVESGCREACPNGESMKTFAERTCAAFDRAVRECIEKKKTDLVVVAHGGNIMAIMTRYADPNRSYFEWYVNNCAGYLAVLDEKSWEENPFLFEYERFDTLHI